MKHGIYIGLVIILLTIIGIGYYKYNKLENSCNKLEKQLQESQIQIDSLSQVNEELKDTIDFQANVIKLYEERESMYRKIKKELESKLDNFVIKNNLDSAVITLRQNIWEYSH